MDDEILVLVLVIRMMMVRRRMVRMVLVIRMMMVRMILARGDIFLLLVVDIEDFFPVDV